MRPVVPLGERLPPPERERWQPGTARLFAQTTIRAGLASPSDTEPVRQSGRSKRTGRHQATRSPAPAPADLGLKQQSKPGTLQEIEGSFPWRLPAVRHTP